MKECKHDEYCPLYLSYLGENNEEIRSKKQIVKKIIY